MDSKFINSQTIEYLKAKQGDTFQQQLNNIKSRLDFELDNMDKVNKEIANEVLRQVTKVEGLLRDLHAEYASALTASSNGLSNRLSSNECLIDQLEKKIKKASIVVAVLLTGVVACLAKLLI